MKVSKKLNAKYFIPFASQQFFLDPIVNGRMNLKSLE